MPQTTRSTSPAAKPQYDPIDPRWLAKAIALVCLAALLCGYITLCLLFYQGQWQFVLHPTRDDLASPGQPIHFDASDSGIPRLAGTLLPAPSGARYFSYTILYLRGGDSSLAISPADALTLKLLASLGLNVFAFDYRGFGQSDQTHPTQSRMAEDTAAAFRYLQQTRSIPEDHILLYGTGVGASLATVLAGAHPRIPALILDSPGPKPISIVLSDPRARFLPIRALFHEDFSLAPLATLTTPKLLITYPGTGSYPPAAYPKFTLELQPNDTANRAAAIARFLDQYLAP